MSFSELTNHVKKLLKKIPHRLLGQGEDPYYDATNDVVYLPAHLHSLDDYFDSLQVIAHKILGHKDGDWDHNVRMNLKAWQWAYENSIIPVTQTFRDKVDRERLKGSWE